MTLSGPNGPVEITDYQYLENFGDPLPEEPELPEAAYHAWACFWKLNNRRQPGFETACPLSYTEIRNWSEMTRTYITTDDVEIITTLDDRYLKAIREGKERRRERDKRKDNG